MDTGALYDSLNFGRIDVPGLRRALAVLPQPKAADARLVLGITPVGRRRTSRVYPSSPGLAHARAYAALHGHLACSRDTRHDGFALGDWLVQTRRRARQGGLAPTALHALDTLDAWWNPPWPSIWQRTYQQALLTHRSGKDRSPALQRWTERQRTRWTTLHPQQQRLLTTIDIHPNL